MNFLRGRPIPLPQLPAMKCDEGCGECCGAVIVSREEYARIAAMVAARGITPQRQGIRCPLYLDGACSVYESRPLVCRMFGHGPDGSVLRGCVKGHDTPAPGHDWAKWKAALNREGAGGIDRMRWLHELAYGMGEIADILAPAASGNPHVKSLADAARRRA